MKYTFTQILICALSSSYWLSSCGKLFPIFINPAVCVTGIMAMPLASLMAVVFIGLCAKNHQRHVGLGLLIWLLSALFVYSFSN
ncbi:MAG: hypothetical protein KBC57_03660 [Neisseriaceae bacterium]|nr:hypothetical protein [Neisseriaceae bacterium]MBP6861434.1 hypothetical protein [Neisseriaceae bacterium]